MGRKRLQGTCIGENKFILCKYHVNKNLRRFWRRDNRRDNHYTTEPATRARAGGSGSTSTPDDIVGMCGDWKPLSPSRYCERMKTIN